MKRDLCKEQPATMLRAPRDRLCLCPESTCAVLEMQATYLEIQAAKVRFAKECKTLRETLAFGVAAE